MSIELTLEHEYGHRLTLEGPDAENELALVVASKGRDDAMAWAGYWLTKAHAVELRDALNKFIEGVE